MTATMEAPPAIEETAPTEDVTLYATVDTRQFAAALKAVKPAVNTKSSLPALQCVVLFAAQDGSMRLCVAATNLDTSLCERLGNSEASGVAVVPFKELYALAETLPPGDLTLTALRFGKRTNSILRFGMGYITGEIYGWDSDDYPNIPGIYESASTVAATPPTAPIERPDGVTLDEGETKGGARHIAEGDFLDANGPMSDGTDVERNDAVATMDDEQERAMATKTVSIQTRKKAAVKATKEARLRYCLHNGKVEAFFDKALKAGVPVQLRTKHGTPHDMKDLKPVGKDGEEYVLKSGKKEVRIPMAEPVYLQYMA